MKKRVVITGLGAITGLGEGKEALWESLISQTSAIEEMDLGAGFKVPGAFYKNFDAEKYVTQRKSLKVMARDIQLAVGSASLALEDALLKDTSFNPERAGIIVGAGVLNHELDELAYSIQASMNEEGKLDLKKFGEDGLHALFPLWLLKYLPNMPACHISILFNLQGPNNTVTTGASGGMQAIGEAYHIIERGDADFMLAGGTESKVNPVGISQYKLLGLLCDAKNENPKNLYKPFHRHTKGFVVGEAAAFLLLEELEHAKKRGAKIYAEVAGFGASSNHGRKISVEKAIEDASLKAEDIDLLQACGVGLLEDDRYEAKIINEIFKNSKKLSVSSSKALTGFTGFASGALDAVISTLSLSKETVLPAANISSQDLVGPLPMVTGKAVPKKIKHALTNSFGFQGQSASLITKCFEGV